MSTEGGRILLVEDDPNDVALVERAFRKSGSGGSLYVVRDGEEAISYLDGNSPYDDRSQYPLPSVMLLDLKLPRLSGFEVLEWLHEQPKIRRMPVIVLTSSNQPDDINRAYDLGANSYLVKPVSFDSLATILDLCNQYWLQLNYSPDFDS